ncbi:MAG: insulinase family protein [candidate division KSB1 bacterium]|nr:insulinase family protein [candidate division KSB1 bacterium]
MKARIWLALAIVPVLVLGCARRRGVENMVLLPAHDDPTVSFRFLFQVGSQDDPPGKEGLAALTAALLTEGSTQKRPYEEILDLLYPMAASISEQVDKEVTVFAGRVHKDHLARFYDLFKEVLLEPSFREEDFVRVKTDFLNHIRNTLRYADDEELGKEALYQFIFRGSPYEHLEEGTVAGLESITLDDVREFYRKYYTRDRLVIGLGGGFEAGFPERVCKDFAILPAGTAPRVPAPEPERFEGIHVRIIEKDVPATAISFGFPIEVLRGSRDFYALALATSWLGEHRNSFSHLYQVIREARGLNYGDYAYIEHFPNGGRRQFPPPNVPRRRQIFQIWIRPVPNEARLFAFRAALRELQKLVDQGMTKEQFELTRKFLKGYLLHYAPTTDLRLGYALDDRFYGIDGHYLDNFRRALDELTLEEVNAAIRRHLQYRNIKVVFVTRGAAELKEALISNAPSPISYPTPKPTEVLEEDREIATYPLAVKPENVEIVPVDVVFER